MIKSLFTGFYLRNRKKYFSKKKKNKKKSTDQSTVYQ